MKFPLVLVGALAGAASAHSDPRDINVAMPKMLGGRKFLSELRARHALPAPVPEIHVEEERAIASTPTLEEREGTPTLEERKTLPTSSDGSCGPGVGYCTNCCSPAGW